MRAEVTAGTLAAARSAHPVFGLEGAGRGVVSPSPLGGQPKRMRAVLSYAAASAGRAGPSGVRSA